MRIAGYQPLTLTDYPGVIAAIVFTQGCALRCLYCHNPELIPHQAATPLLDEAHVLRRLAARAGFIQGLVVTGGEPTLQPDLPAFLRKVKDTGLLVKLDTNGINPRTVAKLLDLELLDFVALDLKHVWPRYTEVIGKGLEAAVPNVRQTMELLQESGIPHEFRTTVYGQLHEERDLHDIAAQLRTGETYALQPIRYQKTLQPDLPRQRKLDVSAAAARLQADFPHLNVVLRD